VPKIPDGVYTIVLSYHTQTDFGVLWSKRQVRVEFPFYETLRARYEAARKQKNLDAMRTISSRVLAGWKGRRVKPGEAVKAATVRFGKPQPDKLSAVARWYPGAEGVRVEVEVTDGNFGVNAENPMQGSSVSLFFAAGGFDDTRSQFTVVPSGPEDAPVIETGGAGPIRAVWKRTENGYHITATVPYTSIKGYRKDWKLMPVDVMVNSKNADGRCALVAGADGEPADNPEHGACYYLGLLR